MSEKLRFGLDCDGILYNWDKTARFLLNYHFGYDLKVSEHWDHIKERVSKEHYDWLWKDGVEKHGLFRYGHMYKGTAEALPQLAKLVDIVIITHRPANAVQDTLEWLAFHRFPATEVQILTRQQPKSGIKSCQFYLDDGPHNIRDLHEKVPDAIVMLWKRTWNTGAVRALDDVVPVATWEEVLEVVRQARQGKTERAALAAIKEA